MSNILLPIGSLVHVSLAKNHVFPLFRYLLIKHIPFLMMYLRNAGKRGNNIKLFPNNNNFIRKPLFWDSHADVPSFSSTITHKVVFRLLKKKRERTNKFNNWVHTRCKVQRGKSVYFRIKTTWNAVNLIRTQGLQISDARNSDSIRSRNVLAKSKMSLVEHSWGLSDCTFPRRSNIKQGEMLLGRLTYSYFFLLFSTATFLILYSI